MPCLPWRQELGRVTTLRDEAVAQAQAAQAEAKEAQEELAEVKRRTAGLEFLDVIPSHVAERRSLSRYRE